MYDLDKFDFSTTLDNVFKSSIADVFFKNPFGEKFPAGQVEGFEDKGGKYEFRHDFGKNAQKSDIQVSLENESEIEVSYYHKGRHSISSFKFNETIPEDAIPETLTASIDNGVLVVSVDKKKEEDTPGKKGKREIQIKA